MKVSDFDYELPEELIAQEPVSPRSYSRLMVVDKEKDKVIVDHRRFYDILDQFKKGDLLILNKTKVMQAKLVGQKATGGKVEAVLYSKPKQDDIKNENKINALIKSTSINIGDYLVFGNESKMESLKYKDIKSGRLNRRLERLKRMKNIVLAKVLGRDEDIFDLKFSIPYRNVMEKFGIYPLPPYIKSYDRDLEKYQTVFSKDSSNVKKMSVAAPTSGLHYTRNLLKKIKAKGVKIVYVNLAIGLGTFKPLLEENVEDNNLHEEMVYIDKKTADIINSYKNKKNAKIFVNGTTALRALESSADNAGKLHPMFEATNLFCYPGYKFKFKFDGLITNFHLPKSSLIMLISAWFGKKDALKVYRIGVDEKYRFFSFGDAMLLKKNI